MNHRPGIFLAASALMIGGCARPAPESAAPPAIHPLAGLVGSRVVVLPVQYLTISDSLGWRPSVPSTSAYLSVVDSEIAFALDERVPDHRWVVASKVVASARRNPVAPDPRRLSAEGLRGRLPVAGQSLSETLRTQVRALVALDGSRYALLPVEMRMEGGRGTGRPTLRVVLIDARLAQVQWAADVTGTPASAFGPSLAAGVAARLASLLVVP